MYTIDTRVLRTSLGIELMPFFRDPKELEDKMHYYQTLTLDLILGVMNSALRNTNDAIDDCLDQYRDDRILPFLSETIYDEVQLIKKQFILAGFDRRLKYKLIKQQIPKTNRFIYVIAMDLDATVEEMNTRPVEANEDITDVISDNPTYEQLAALFGFTGIN